MGERANSCFAIPLGARPLRHTLFAPWRMEFIENPESDSGCVLCKIHEADQDSEKHVIARGAMSYVVLNKFPYSHGHMMVVPYRHENDWTNLSSEEIAEIGSFTQTAIRIISKNFNTDGFNIGVNLGRAAGAGIEDHVHQHIVPRWVGDFNFMPLLSETKVISEHLDRTYQRILESWNQK